MARDGFFNTDSQKDGLHVAVQILVAVVAELRLYGIWPVEGRIAELLRFLETAAVKGTFYFYAGHTD
jgi:hypothetical protein